MLHEQVGHFPASVGRHAEARGLHVRLVDEGFFLPRDRIQERGEKGLGAVGKIEGEGLDMLADSVQRGHSSGFGENAGSESQVDFGEEQGCGADTEIMAGEAE